MCCKDGSGPSLLPKGVTYEVELVENEGRGNFVLFLFEYRSLAMFASA